MDVFVSVGTDLNPRQEEFVRAVEDQLRALGMAPCTIGRNTFSTDAPLKAVVDLMDRCEGVVVIAVERYRFSAGVERPGSGKERPLANVALPTVWNQIEASLGYSRNLPLLVLVDEQVRCDGLLEKGNDWYVHSLSIEPAALNSPAFVGLLGSWRDRVARERKKQQSKTNPMADPTTLSIAQLVSIMKPAQLWAALVGAAGALAGAYAIGTRLGP